MLSRDPRGEYLEAFAGRAFPVVYSGNYLGRPFSGEGFDRCFLAGYRELSSVFAKKPMKEALSSSSHILRHQAEGSWPMAFALQNRVYGTDGSGHSDSRCA